LLEFLIPINNQLHLLVLKLIKQYSVPSKEVCLQPLEEKKRKEEKKATTLVKSCKQN
jgi:hypothetical protein